MSEIYLTLNLILQMYIMSKKMQHDIICYVKTTKVTKLLVMNFLYFSIKHIKVKTIMKHIVQGYIIVGVM